MRTGPKEKPHHCLCGEHNPNSFYPRVKGICKSCYNRCSVNTLRQLKKRVVEYLGGSCKECGYSKFQGALDLHHRDPSEKDPDFRKMYTWSFNRVKKELDKCDLLCRNCHAIKHYLP